MAKTTKGKGIADVPRPPGPSAVQIQQDYYEAIGGVDWELFQKHDRQFLLQKIAVALYGPPTKEGNLILEEPGDKTQEKKKPDKNTGNGKKDKKPGDEFQIQGYEPRDEEGIKKVFNKICEQAKYSHDGENILITVLRVVCVIPKKEVGIFELTPSNYWEDLHDKNGDHVYTYVFHVFCVRQCISMNPGVAGCRTFIDHDARVYKDWNDYITENTLPKSVLVVPENGQYSGTFGSDFDVMQLQFDDAMPRVKLSVVPSPALGIGAKVLKVTDTMSTVANVGALVGVGAVAAPVIAPVALGAAVGVGAVTGTYAIVRASISLADRKKHEQSIGLDNSEARGCWINILVSTAGLSFSAAGKLLSWAASSGTNIKILMNAVDILKFTNLGTGFIGVANSLGDMIYNFHKYNETPSSLEVFQFTTSLLFLGVGVMSNQTATEIVQDAQANKINEVRESLSSNNKRKMFDKVTAETRRTRGTIQGNAEVIKALKKIDNKDEFFGKLRGINKQLNKNKLRISLSSDGNPLINNQHNIKVSDLQTLGSRGRDQLFAKYGPAKIDSKNVPTRLVASNSATSSTASVQQTACPISLQEIAKISSLIVNLSKIDQEFVAEILSNLSASCHDAFLLICAELIVSFIPSEIDFLFGGKHHKLQVILFVLDYLKSLIPVNESGDSISLSNVLKKYVRDGRIPKETILEFKGILIYRITQKKKLFDDPRLFDLMHDYDTRGSQKYLTIQGGEILKLGQHEILIKNSTIEKLEEWNQLMLCTQRQSDMLLNLCFEIVSCLSTNQLYQLNEINPDIDAIQIVSYYLLFVADGIFDILVENFVGTDFLADVALNLKDELMNWRICQNLRKYETCKMCRGRRYKDLNDTIKS